MKQFLIGLLGGILILAACTPATAENTLQPSPSGTPTMAPATFTPSQTQIPPTRTITPLPTIPTFTPTFDAWTIVTVTPAAKAECPEEDNSLQPNFKFDDNSIDIEHEILKYLNDGGSIQKIIDEISKIYPYPPRLNNAYAFTDVTKDGIPDLVFDGFPTSYNDVSPIYHTFYILSCHNGQYTLFSGEDTIGTALFNTIYKIIDMNKNGVPEIVVYNNKCSGGGCYSFFIGEWNGKTFVNLAHNIFLDSIIDGKIQDTNNDETSELILTGGLYDRSAVWRSEIHTYMWNGKHFAEQPTEYVQPVYRFQAIQDADTAVLIGKHDKAFQLYQEAISNQRLEWWSVERQKYEQAIINAPWNDEPTPSVKPSKDETEYLRLAAYAYYRTILLHIVQGHASDAGTVYKTLQQKFSSDQYGHPYVEMATAFWESYQPTHKMYNGCAAAIQYAAEHPEILIPLGSDYHGSQSHIYVPADVCPFR